MTNARPRIAVFSGPTATIQNSAALVTSNKARLRAGLPLLIDRWGTALRFDALRAQRLAKPVTVYVEQFSAHPLERDAADLYAPPDGYLDREGDFHRERTSEADTPVYEVELRPEDGLLPLPYMALQGDGTAWDGDTAHPMAPPSHSRQPFYPDASRVFEEIDRLGVREGGQAGILSSEADYDFVRILPSSGYSKGLPAAERTDVGDGDIDPESIWTDYFPYRPPHLRREPSRAMLATITNRITAALARHDYAGAIWLEGSPYIEETTYWLNLVLDTTIPIAGCASLDFAHGALGAGGDQHIVEAVRYVTSRVWSDASGDDEVGTVIISASQVFASRDAQKADARPGGFISTGGHGGVIGAVNGAETVITYRPNRRHTHTSSLRLSSLPTSVMGVRQESTGLGQIEVPVRDADGLLIPDAIPFVSIHKHARYLAEDTSADPASEVELLSRLAANLSEHPLAGFVVEGAAPYGTSGPSADALLRRATFSGMPMVRTGRGNAEGFVPHERVQLGIAGSNLTATKARILLMACLLKFGALPIAADPDHPTDAEIDATKAALAAYQAIFDTH